MERPPIDIKQLRELTAEAREIFNAAQGRELTPLESATVDAIIEHVEDKLCTKTS